MLAQSGPENLPFRCVYVETSRLYSRHLQRGMSDLRGGLKQCFEGFIPKLPHNQFLTAIKALCTTLGRKQWAVRVGI